MQTLILQSNSNNDNLWVQMWYKSYKYKHKKYSVETSRVVNSSSTLDSKLIFGPIWEEDWLFCENWL